MAMSQEAQRADGLSGGYGGWYGDKFEPWIIGAMSLLIVASFVGVYMLWQHYIPECQVMEYTYCPEQSSGPAEH